MPCLALRLYDSYHLGARDTSDSTISSISEPEERFVLRFPAFPGPVGSFLRAKREALSERREKLSPNEERSPSRRGNKEKRKVSGPQTTSLTLATYASFRPCPLDPLAQLPAPSPEPWRPTDPTFWTKPYCSARSCWRLCLRLYDFQYFGARGAFRVTISSISEPEERPAGLLSSLVELLSSLGESVRDPYFLCFLQCLVPRLKGL